jgi:hypothetical protein
MPLGRSATNEHARREDRRPINCCEEPFRIFFLIGARIKPGPKEHLPVVPIAPIFVVRLLCTLIRIRVMASSGRKLGAGSRPL